MLTGGRGKAGGVKVVSSKEEAERAAGEILGMSIKGFDVQKVLVTEKVDITAEYYAGVTIDRDSKSVVLIISASGGMDIEEVCRTSARKFDLVHRRHRQARTINHAADLPVQANKTKPCPPGFEFINRVFLRIFKFGQLRMPKDTTIVKYYLGIGRYQAIPLDHRQRIDFDKRAVFLPKQAVHLLNNLNGLIKKCLLRK